MNVMNRKYLYAKIAASVACAFSLMLFVSNNFFVYGQDAKTNSKVLGAFYTPTRRTLTTAQAQTQTVTTLRRVISPTFTLVRVPSLTPTKTPTKPPAGEPTSAPTSKPTEPTNAPATSVQTGQTGNAGLESQTISLINSERGRQNLGQLGTDGALTTAARRHAADMCNNNHFSHTGTDGSDFTKRAKDAGYSGFANGEVIGWQHTSVESIFNGWMQSPPHHDIILNSSVTKIGVGWNGNCVVGVVGS